MKARKKSYMAQSDISSIGTHLLLLARAPFSAIHIATFTHVRNIALYDRVSSFHFVIVIIFGAFLFARRVT
jgi:hypothetical protein